MLCSGCCSNSLLSVSSSDSWFQKKWGHNVSEFRQRFDSELTAGEGPKRLRNVYFLYLIELRALAKVLPFFQQPSFRLYTGRPEEDRKHKEMLLEILQLARSAWGLPLNTDTNCLHTFESLIFWINICLISQVIPSALWWDITLHWWWKGSSQTEGQQSFYLSLSFISFTDNLIIFWNMCDVVLFVLQYIWEVFKVSSQISCKLYQNCWKLWFVNNWIWGWTATWRSEYWLWHLTSLTTLSIWVTWVCFPVLCPHQDDVRLAFFNISRIMDCVGCFKCRLWGKLQVSLERRLKRGYNCYYIMCVCCKVYILCGLLFVLTSLSLLSSDSGIRHCA